MTGFGEARTDLVMWTDLVSVHVWNLVWLVAVLHVAKSLVPFHSIALP